MARQVFTNVFKRKAARLLEVGKQSAEAIARGVGAKL
jgi:hypothetical protein